MHPRDNLLRAWIDQELPENQVGPLQAHLASCPGCQARLARLQARAGRVQARLDVLAPSGRHSQTTPQAAFARVMRKSRQPNPRKELDHTMTNRRPLWTALAVIAILALVFTITPARAWASSFLGLFRVQKVAVLEFDPMAARGSVEGFSTQQEAFDRVINQYVTIEENGDPYEVATLEEAAGAAGFTPRVPPTLQDGLVSVQPPMSAEIIIDQDEMQALFDAFQVNVQINPELDGQTVNVFVPAGVIVTEGCPPEASGTNKFGDCVSLFQVPSPTINAPEGLNVDVLGEALLQFLGYSPQEARAFSQTIDWTSTLLIPVPSGQGIQYQDVTVGGVPGTLLTSAEEPGYLLLWVKDGVLFGLRGPGSAEEALEIANAVP
jgi:anti-sigma factor RsiW